MPDLPTTRRGAATSRRILDAAAGEFAERGIAGARMDRITATASTNKAQVYGYFGSKDGLFDAVISDRADELMLTVAFTSADLPTAAVALYDANLRHPEMVRLMTWLRLERRPTGRLTDHDSADRQAKLDAIARAQAAGTIRPGDPLDIFALVVSMALAWSSASGIWAASPDEPPEVHNRRRDLLRATVAAALAP